MNLEKFKLNRTKIMNILFIALINLLYIIIVLYFDRKADNHCHIHWLDLGIINAVVLYFILKLRRKEFEIGIHEKYLPVMEELIEEANSNQHEFKNHLHAISGMIYMDEGTCLKEYVSELGYECKNAAKVVDIDNPIVLGLLYSMKVEANKKKSSFKYYCTDSLKQLPIKDSEMVVILSNLINNAIEAVVECGKKERKIELLIYKTHEHFMIEICNTSVLISEFIQKNAFKKGFTTKAKGHGLGLVNTANILKKYSGGHEISYSNNRIRVSVSIPLQKYEKDA